MFKKIIAAGLSLIFVGLLFNSQAAAEEITISVSGNGGGSNNSVEVTANTTTTVTQTNNADIHNDVSSDANTGDNTVSSNNGEAAIVTGDATGTTDIANQGINLNSADNPCGDCQNNPINISIKGNGSDSINAVGLGISNNSGAYQSNSAQITNNVTNSANTGYNNANNNNGDVAIVTGDAWVETLIKNKNINFSSAVLGNFDNALSVLINGNGDGSINLVKLLFDNTITSESRNFSVIFNNVTNSANTGGNVANSNNGAVLIATGDAVSIVSIANENINGSRVDVSCGCKITPPPPPGGDGEPPVVPPATPPSSGGNGGGSTSVGNSAGQVLGAAIGTVLPATGGYFLLLMTILCFTLFLAGGYLRFGSGISPPLAYA